MVFHLAFLVLIPGVYAQINPAQVDLKQALGLLNDHPGLADIYQQPEPLTEDLLGDVLLLNTVQILPKSIKAQMKGNFGQVFADRLNSYASINEKFPEITRLERTDLEYEIERLTVQNSKQIRKSPFNVRRMSQAFQQVIVEEAAKGLAIHRGEAPGWTKEFRQRFNKPLAVWPKFSKLFLALSRGVTYRFFITGQESKLQTWLLAQPLNSVYPHDLFRQSLQLSSGNISQALLSVENLLSKHWKIPNRANLKLTRRLARITNGVGDNDDFGHWYHLFGLISFGYEAGAIKAVTAGKLETLGSHILSKFEKEFQENRINNKGGRVGASLRRWVRQHEKQNDWNRIQSNPQWATSGHYLTLIEEHDL